MTFTHISCDPCGCDAESNSQEVIDVDDEATTQQINKENNNNVPLPPRQRRKAASTPSNNNNNNNNNKSNNNNNNNNRSFQSMTSTPKSWGTSSRNSDSSYFDTPTLTKVNLSTFDFDDPDDRRDSWNARSSGNGSLGGMGIKDGVVYGDKGEDGEGLEWMNEQRERTVIEIPKEASDSNEVRFGTWRREI